MRRSLSLVVAPRRLIWRLSCVLALVVTLGVWPRPAAAAPCKTDGTGCRTNQSCCGTNGHNGLCVNSAPPGKRPVGECCTPTTCAAAGAECGTIVDGTCLTLAMLDCGTCPAGETCGAGGTPNVCGTTTTTSTTTSTTTTTLSCAPIANPDHFQTFESASGVVLLGNKLFNDADNCGDALFVTDVNVSATPITLTGAGGFVLADVSIVKIAAAVGDVATFQITTADNGDAGTDPQVAYIHIATNGTESLENNSAAFNALFDSGQSLTFNFTYSVSDGKGGTSGSTQDVTITGQSPV